MRNDLYSKWAVKNMDGSTLNSVTGKVDQIDPAKLMQFTISDTASPAIMVCRNKGQEYWFKNGVPYTPSFPLVVPMRDSTYITITRNSDQPFDLIFTQA